MLYPYSPIIPLIPSKWDWLLHGLVQAKDVQLKARTLARNPIGPSRDQPGAGVYPLPCHGHLSSSLVLSPIF